MPAFANTFTLYAMTRLQYFIMLLAIICIISCEEKGSGQKFKAIIADTSLGHENNLLQAYPDFTRKVNLPSIESGVDSFEYRFWLHVEADIINLIRIRFDNSRWVVTETIIYSHIPAYDFDRYSTKNHLLETVVDSTHTRSIVPKIAINSFIDSLQSYNFEEAPSNIQIAGSFSLPTDARTYTIELAAKNSHRMIIYTCPGGAESLHEFHSTVSRFLEFIQVTLNIKFSPC
jgi:hypothetical protein